LSTWEVERTIDTDVLVIGGGMAGCFAAIKARQKNLAVTLVDKAVVGRSGATHFSEGDFTFFNPERGHDMNAWINQINRASEYLNDRDWTEVVLRDSYDRYQDLVRWGVKFVEMDGKTYARQAGVHEHFAMVNRRYAPTLRRVALDNDINIIDRLMICDLLKQDGRIAGAVAFHTTSGHLYIINSKAIVVAAGDGGIKSEAKPTAYMTGDGEAIAYRVGARITGKEFLMSLGTSIPRRPIGAPRVEPGRNHGMEIDILPRYPRFRGGVMGPTSWPTLNAEGSPVSMPAWEVHNGRAPLYVDLDAFTPEEVTFGIHGFFARMGTNEPDKIGLDLFNGGKLKFSPGRVENAQGIHGGNGIRPIDLHGTSDIPGLYAAGSGCATMLSGASYAGMGLGLCHAMTTGARAGTAAARCASNTAKVKLDESELKRIKETAIAPVLRKGGFSPAWVTQSLQGLVIPYYILQIKHSERMQAALTLVEFMNNHIVPKIMAKDPHELRMAHETRNMVLNMEMILRASLFRTESRGKHFREDYPLRDDPEWLAWVMLKNEEGKMSVSKEPIPEKWWPDLSMPYKERYPGRFPLE
jgi:succinate dehydrogenase/fumarate reductase flavoprotein subunit